MVSIVLDVMLITRMLCVYKRLQKLVIFPFYIILYGYLHLIFLVSEGILLKYSMTVILKTHKNKL